MTIARNHHIFLHQPTYFHLISRCVRRAFLCGKDKHTGKRYDHRKRWLKQRLFELSELFFVDVYGYAIMSNHYHLVVQTRPDEMSLVDDAAIALRWSQLFPCRGLSEQARVSQLCRDSAKIKLYRERLCDISWLMRCINEPVARKANKEDGCNGRFWQGRFRSQLLLDESAVYTCMAYVDLNPVRAGVVTTPEESLYTSINHRITHHALDDPLMPLNSSAGQLPLRLADYLVLVDEAGRCIRDEHSGIVLDRALPILTHLNINANGYVPAMKHLSRWFYRVIGHECGYEELAERLSLNWLKGRHRARQLFGA